MEIIRFFPYPWVSNTPFSIYFIINIVSVWQESGKWLTFIYRNLFLLAGRRKKGLQRFHVDYELLVQWGRAATLSNAGSKRTGKTGSVYSQGNKCSPLRLISELFCINYNRPWAIVTSCAHWMLLSAMLCCTLNRYKPFKIWSVREGSVLVYFPLCSLTPSHLMQDFSMLLLSMLHSTHDYLASRKGKVERIQIIFLMLLHCLRDWVKDLLWFEHCRIKTKAGTTVSLQLTDAQRSHSHAAQTLPLHHASRCSGWFSFLSYLALTGFLVAGVELSQESLRNAVDSLQSWGSLA